MQSATRSRVLRVVGGVVAGLAFVPWLGVGAAQAAASDDGSCSTRPAGVSPGASCALLLGPNGTKVFGETWVLRTKANQLTVQTFPLDALSSGDPVRLCVRSGSPYPARHVCSSFDADIAYDGDQTSVSIALGAFGISATDAVWYDLTVDQGSSAAVSTGNGGSVPSPSPSPTSTGSGSPSGSPSGSTSPSHTPTGTPSGSPSGTPSGSPTGSPSHSPSGTPSGSPSHSPSGTPSGSPSVSPSHSPTGSPSGSASGSASGTPSVSASASATGHSASASPSTSVLGTKLARTGAGDVDGALLVSVSLLAMGGLLLLASQTAAASARRRH